MKTPSRTHLVSTLLTFFVGSVPAEEARILSIRQVADKIVVEARVPEGSKRVTLEARGAEGSWQPRSVQRPDGAASQVSFDVPIDEDFELLRVRAEQTEKLAAKFFHGVTSFQEYSAATEEAAPSSANLTLLEPSGGGRIFFNVRGAEVFNFQLGPYGIDDLFPVDDYLVEVSHAGGTNNNGVVRVASAANPHAELTKLELQNGLIRASAFRDSKLYVLQSKYVSSLHLLGPGREQAVTLSIIDLANLPNLTVAGEVGTNLTLLDFASDIEPVWPTENVLVFASTPRTGQPLRLRTWDTPTTKITFHNRARLNPSEGGQGFVFFLPTVKTIWFPSPVQPVLPITYPVFSVIAPLSSTPELIAFDVTDFMQPRFASKVTLDPIVSSAASEFYTTNDLVYLSHTVTELQITGSNAWVNTVFKYHTTTNIAPVTNIVSVPERAVTTNEVTRTEIEATLTGIHLVTNVLDQFTVSRFVRSGADSSAEELIGLAAGSRHMISLGAEGKVDAWGNNAFDQLGSSLLHILPEITSIAAGDSHTLALDTDGAVWGWGANYSEQVIPAVSAFPVPFPTLSQQTPVVVPGLPPTADLAAGSAQSLALAQNGEVWAWGDNTRGQLGMGDQLPRSGPVAVLGLSNIVRIAAGSAHNLALDSEGRLFVWGDNSQGQLGREEPILSTPTILDTSIEIIAIAAGHQHTLLLTEAGDVFASGDNAHGALGSGSVESRLSFEQVSGLPAIVKITAGRDHSLAIDADGRIWAWGRNDFGQSDAVGGEDVLDPRNLHFLPPMSAVTGGGAFSFALTEAGELWAWGENRHGELGRGSEYSHTNYFQVTEVQTVTNYVYQTNTVVELVVATNLVYLRHTNVVLRTNITNLQYLASETNWYNTYRQVNKSYANVIDFSNSASPVVRRPISIPGKLAGLSHDGAILYTTAAHSSTNGEFQGQWVEAVSYDGAAAYHVDGKRIDGFSAPIVKVAHGRAFVLDETGANLRVFQLSATPSLDLLATIPIPRAHEIEMIGSRLLVKCLDSSILLFDPETLLQDGKTTFPSSAYFPLEALVPGPTGFWVPRGWQAPLQLILQQE